MAKRAGIVGRTYLERGKPVTVLVQWGDGRGDPDARRHITWCGPEPKTAPHNVLIQRADGTRTVRPFRGLRVPRDPSGEDRG